MNIRLKTIDIENFRSISKAKICLENQGTVIVKGINEYEDKATSNGSGKSSIFEAIIFCIFEETSSGEKDVANRIVNDGYVVTLQLEIDGVNYTITRQCKKNKTSVLFYKENVDISARNKTDTNKLIINTLGITKNIFLDSVFLSQNVSTNLASLTPTARKERLEVLTNTDTVINTFKEQLKEKQIQYETQCVNTQMEISKLNGNKESIIKQKQDIQDKINQINLQMEALKSLGDLNQIEQDIKQYEQSIISMDNEISEYTNSINSKEIEIQNIRQSGESNISKKEELDSLKQNKLNEYNDINSKINKLQTDNNYERQTQERLDKELEELKNSDKCPTCGRKYENVNEEHIISVVNEKTNLWNVCQIRIDSNNEEITKLQLSLDTIKQEGTELSNQISEVQTLIENNKDLVNKQELERKTLINNQQQLYSQKQDYQTQINILQNKKEQILKTEITNIKQFEDMIKSLDEQIKQIDEQIKQIEQVYNENNTYIEVIKNSIQLVTKEFRTYLLQNSLQYLNKLLYQYSSQLFSNEKDIIKIEEDDTKLNIKLGDATFESLSGGEKTRVNIALLLAQKSLANIVGNISCNIIILDEILGYCDNEAETNVINLITQELESLETIYMVSHKEIPIGYDAQLIVIKNKKGLSEIINP